jgi:hypothetical protein
MFNKCQKDVAIFKCVARQFIAFFNLPVMLAVAEGLEVD